MTTQYFPLSSTLDQSHGGANYVWVLEEAMEAMKAMEATEVQDLLSGLSCMLPTPKGRL